MIHSIMRIGKWAQQSDDAEDVCARFVENPNAKGNIHKVIKIVFKYEGDSIQFHDVGLEEYREKYINKYFYRRKHSRGANVTPTASVTDAIEKTYCEKVYRNINDLLNSFESIGLNEKEKQYLQKIKNALDENEEMIFRKLVQREWEIDGKGGAILTMVFDRGGQNQYVGDIVAFKKAMRINAKKGFYQKHKTESLSKDKYCYVCRKLKKEVYGFASTFTFYTADMRNFVAGGFDQAVAWKNYPVCFDCALNLEAGKNYLFRRLRFSFYGFSYLLVPKFNGAGLMDDVFEIMEDISNEKAGQMIKAGFEQSFVDLLTDAEEEIFGLIGEKEDYVGFDLLFFKEKNAKFDILLHVEDVLPSRLKTFFDVKKRLDEIGIFKAKTDKKGRRELVFNFGILRRIFPYVSKTQTYDRHFLETTGKIFTLKPVDCPFLIRAIMRKVRTKFGRGERSELDLLGGYLLLNFLAEINILSKGGEIMDVVPIEELGGAFDDKNASTTEKVRQFFESHRGFFDHPSKKACFLVGVLSQKLMNTQFRTSNSKPFRKKLHSLRLTEPLVKRIAFEAQNKLEQYGKNYYRELEALIAQYMVAAGGKWKFSNDDIAFYFTMGMNLANLFKNAKEEDLNDDTEE